MKTSEKGNGPQIDEWFKWKRRLLFFVVPLLSLVAIQPILTGVLPWRGDGLLHLYRLAELERAIRDGVFFPRWSPDLGYGFGFPLFHYYAPFSYYIGVIPRLLGFSLPISMAVSYILSLWVLGWAVWLWARDVWQSWLATITAVLAILYAPYILYNTYHRAALAELWGLAFLGMTLWAVQKLFGDWRLVLSQAEALEIGAWSRSVSLVATFYALLILSHNITALIGTPLIIGYALFLTINHQQSTVNSQQTSRITHHASRIKSFILHPTSFIFLSLLLGLGLSAFFWLPAFFERHLVQIENLTATANFSYLSHFLNLKDVFAWPQTAVSQQVNPNIPRTLGWPILILALLAWLPVKMVIGDWRLEIGLSHRLALTIVTLLCLFMVLPISKPFWQAIELLSFVQFPWRFLGPTSLFLAMLAAFGAQQLWNLIHSQFTIHNSLFTISLATIIILYALPWLFPSQAHNLPNDISPSETAVFEKHTGWLGTTAAADYLPDTVTTLPEPDGFTNHLDTTQFPDTFKIERLEEEFTAVSLTYNAQKPTTAVFHIFHFPGWQATLEGQPAQIVPSEPHGQITVQLPAGTHTLHLAFGNTPLRTVANIISLISLMMLIMLFAYCVLRKNKKQQTVNNQQPTTNNQHHHSPFTIYHSPFTIHHFLPAILTVLVIFAVKTAVLDHSNTIFHTAQHSALSTQPLANFNNSIQLIGTDLPDAPIPADQPIDLTLYWQVLPPVDEEFSISVQLIGANNIRYAQSDSFHPAGLPLPRWQAGEFGVDQHRLTALVATPPGEYDLTVFVYKLANGQRLDTFNKNNLPIGNEYHLGTVTLTQPTTFPNPDELQISQRKTADDEISPFLAENVQLLGFDLPIQDAVVGDFLPITLFWYAPSPPQQDYLSGFWISCEKQGIIIPSYPRDDSAPDVNWQEGKVERVDLTLHIPLYTAQGNPVQDDACTLYLDLESKSEEGAQEREFITLTNLQVTAPDRNFDLPDTAVSINQSLANQVTLAAYELNQNSVEVGETIPLTLYWQPETLFSEDYKVFVQLLGQDGRIVAQQDKIPADGARPTTGWIPDEIIYDSYELIIPTDAPAGTYQLITGLYNAQTGQRLTLADQSGDAITIPIPIEVKLAE